MKKEIVLFITLLIIVVITIVYHQSTFKDIAPILEDGYEKIIAFEGEESN